MLPAANCWQSLTAKKEVVAGWILTGNYLVKCNKWFKCVAHWCHYNLWGNLHQILFWVTSLPCPVSISCLHHLVNVKLGSLIVKQFQKIGIKILISNHSLSQLIFHPNQHTSCFYSEFSAILLIAWVPCSFTKILFS